MRRGGSWRRLSDWRRLSSTMIHNCFLDSDLLAESLNWILSFQFLEFNRSILIKELINGKIATTHSDFDVILLNFDGDFLCAKLVYAFTFSHKHDLKFLPLRIVVDELRQFSIDAILLDGDVYSNTLLQIHNILLQRLNLNFGILELFKQF